MTPPAARHDAPPTPGSRRPPIYALADELRLACMRISRRVRFESTDAVAPHQFSVLCRLEEAPRTPQRARRHRAGERPEHDPHRRRPRRARARRAHRRPHRRAPGDPVADPRGPTALLKRHPPQARRSGCRARVEHLTDDEQDVLAAGRGACSPGWPASEPHLLLARRPQLPHLRLGRVRLQHRHLDGPGRPGLARAHRAHRPLGDGPRHRHRAAVPALPAARAVGRHDRRPLPQAPHPAASPRRPCSLSSPAARRARRRPASPSCGRSTRSRCSQGSPPPSTTRPGRPSSPRWCRATSWPTPSPSTARRSTSAGSSARASPA